MSTGLNASLSSFVTLTTISSSVMNSNLAALNGATAPDFSTTQIDDHLIWGRNSAFLYQMSKFSGTGDATVTHGCSGQTPTHFSLMQSVTGSQTMGYSAATSTQVTVRAGAGQAWTGIAFVTS